jgi:hypothetical protein
MAIIRTKENKQAKTEKPRAWSCVLKRVPVKLFSRNGYVLVKLNGDAASKLEDAPVDVELRDDVALFNLSRFLRCEISGDEVEPEDANGSGWANIKLRHAEYDYRRNGKKGHTSKLELIGINFITFTAWSNDDYELDADGDDLADVDLPF